LVICVFLDLIDARKMKHIEMRLLLFVLL